MPTRLRKIRRMRGSRHHGWGQVGQHRQSGARGGSGNAGLDKHKWTWTVKYDPDHFGRDRFRPPGQKRPARWINAGGLDGLAAKIHLEKKGGAELNLLRLGYGRLLGGGEVKGSYRILVPSCTKSAQAKVEKAGGEIVTGSRE